MKNNKLKWGLILALIIVIGGGIGAFMFFNQPHRDVQAVESDYQLKAQDLVDEYLTDSKTANQKYLHSKGESKVLTVSGTVGTITQDLKAQQVVLLREPTKDAGVSCTFMLETNVNAEKLKVGDKVTIKGVIRSGAGYNHDLGLYEDVILEKCDVFTETVGTK